MYVDTRKGVVVSVGKCAAAARASTGVATADGEGGSLSPMNVISHRGFCLPLSKNTPNKHNVRPLCMQVTRKGVAVVRQPLCGSAPVWSQSRVTCGETHLGSPLGGRLMAEDVRHPALRGPAGGCCRRYGSL